MDTIVLDHVLGRCFWSKLIQGLARRKSWGPKNPRKTWPLEETKLDPEEAKPDDAGNVMTTTKTEKPTRRFGEHMSLELQKKNQLFALR